MTRTSPSSCTSTSPALTQRHAAKAHEGRHALPVVLPGRLIQAVREIVAAKQLVCCVARHSAGEATGGRLAQRPAHCMEGRRWVEDGWRWLVGASSWSQTAVPVSGGLNRQCSCASAWAPLVAYSNCQNNLPCKKQHPAHRQLPWFPLACNVVPKRHGVKALQHPHAVGQLL